MCSSGNPLLYLYPLLTSPPIGATLVTIIHSYRYFGHVDNRWLSTGGSADNENRGDLGKLKEAVML